MNRVSTGMWKNGSVTIGAGDFVEAPKELVLTFVNISLVIP
jgi:hypothetical protein